MVAAELPPPPAVVLPPPPEPEPPAAVDDLERELQELRPKTAASIRLLLAHRGKVSKLAAQTGLPASHWYSLKVSMVRSERWAIVRALDFKHDGVGGLDLVPCTRCGLRGHLAGDPERCLTGGAGRGLGSSPWMGGDGGL